MRCSAPLFQGRIGESKAHCRLLDTSQPTEMCYGTKEAVTAEGGGQAAADPQTLLLTAEFFFSDFQKDSGTSQPLAIEV